MENWSYFNAWCLIKGLDPWRWAPWDLCDVIQFWLFEGLSDSSADDLERRLTDPPANISENILKDDPIWSDENESDLFGKLLRQVE